VPRSGLYKAALSNPALLFLRQFYALAAKQPLTYKATKPVLNAPARGGPPRPGLVLGHGHRPGQDELAQAPRV
jgi:hypothetical protein